MREARRDVALALVLKAPIWTHDRDVEIAGVRTVTTAQLLAVLRDKPGRFRHRLAWAVRARSPLGLS